MEDGFSSYSSLYDTSSLLQFCNGKASSAFCLSPPRRVDVSPADKVKKKIPQESVCFCVQSGRGCQR